MKDTDTDKQNNLKKVIKILKQNSVGSACVFDLDSTLFCMKHRTQTILGDIFKELDIVKKQSPSVLKKLHQVKVSERDWAIRDLLIKNGITDEDLLLAINQSWRKKFHSESYLKFDKPYSGAVSFVQHVHHLGAKVFYLTARNNSARQGSIKSLNHWKFPLEKNENLIMREASTVQDTEYKNNALQKLSQQFKPIVLFENEPMILNFVNQHSKNIQLFWIDSTHSGQQKPPKEALHVSMDWVF